VVTYRLMPTKYYHITEQRRMGKVMSIPRGHIPLLVGERIFLKKVLVHRKVLQHPYFFGLLEPAAMEFGHDQKGILIIPCEIECFHRIVKLIRENILRKKVIIPCLFFPKCSNQRE
jgi:SAUR family protein